MGHIKCHECKTRFNGDKLGRRIQENLKARQKRLMELGKSYGLKIPAPLSKKPKSGEGVMCRDCLMEKVEEIKGFESK